MKQGQDLLELLNNVDNNLVCLSEDTSTLVNTYEKVDLNNYIQFSEIANQHYNAIIQRQELSGHFIVTWRINFGNLIDFIEANIEQSKTNNEVTQFIRFYNEESTRELYKRLQISL